MALLVLLVEVVLLVGLLVVLLSLLMVVVLLVGLLVVLLWLLVVLLVSHPLGVQRACVASCTQRLASVLRAVGAAVVVVVSRC
jgi:hypothetical protein